MIFQMSIASSIRSNGNWLTIRKVMKRNTAPAGLKPRKDRPNVLPLEGEIDLHVSPDIAASLDMMIQKKPKQLIVDLSRVTYIDSSGLAVLIRGMQNVQEYGGKFALAGLQETIRIIFEIARLDQVFRIYPDAEAALAAA
jgi:anti-sigma B factor antagonist